MAEGLVVFTVRYTEGHCLASAWRYWQRRLGKRYALELAIGAGLYVLARQGPYRWVEVALLIVVGVFALVGAGVFLLHWQRARLGLKALDPPQSTWLLTESSIAQRSNLGESAIAWSAVQQLWQFPDLWLLIWGRDVYSTLPTDQLPAEARDYIRRHVQEAGGKVS